MHHLHKSQIKPSVRRPHEGRYKDALKAQLRLPGLSESHRQAIQQSLQRVGQPRQYPLIQPPNPEGES